MIKFLILRQRDTKKNFYINPNEIINFSENDGGSKVIFSNNFSLETEETPEEIFELINTCIALDKFLNR